MAIDFTKYPSLRSVTEHPPTCESCGGALVRSDVWNVWYCFDLLDCDDCTMLTDGQVEERIESASEQAYERELSRHQQ